MFFDMQEQQYVSPGKISIIAVGITILMVIGVFIHYRQISGRPGTIVLPAGGTYLGPSSQTQPTAQPEVKTVFTATGDTPWHTIHGNIYPYTFSVPTTLTLTTFPNNPYDI